MQKEKLSSRRVDLMLFSPAELVELEQICAYELLTTKGPIQTTTKNPKKQQSTKTPNQKDPTHQPPPPQN